MAIFCVLVELNFSPISSLMTTALASFNLTSFTASWFILFVGQGNVAGLKGSSRDTMVDICHGLEVSPS